MTTCSSASQLTGLSATHFNLLPLPLPPPFVPPPFPPSPSFLQPFPPPSPSSLLSHLPLLSPTSLPSLPPSLTLCPAAGISTLDIRTRLRIAEAELAIVQREVADLLTEKSTLETNARMYEESWKFAVQVSVPPPLSLSLSLSPSLARSLSLPLSPSLSLYLSLSLSLTHSLHTWIFCIRHTHPQHTVMYMNSFSEPPFPHSPIPPFHHSQECGRIVEQRDELHRKLLSLENAVSAASHLEVTMAHVYTCT